MNWMIYGANGYTGKLIAEHAVAQGMRPVLAGRSADKITPLANALGLESRVFALGASADTAAALAGMDAVVHAAGPFTWTSAPMIEACLAAGAHYLDITGEIDVFQHTLAQDTRARSAGVALISGVGFDVVPTDCLANTVAQRVEAPHTLTLAFTSVEASAGTLRTGLEAATGGGRVRRDGRLQSYPIGRGARKIRFNHRELWTMPIPWGDLVTGYHSTGIPNITTLMALPPRLIRLARWTAPGSALLRLKPVRRALQAWVARTVEGPDAETRATARSHVYAAATGPSGTAEAWLETVEAYRLTAEAAVASARRVIAERPTGSLTPAQAFGADFVLEIEGTQRFDSLPVA